MRQWTSGHVLLEWAGFSQAYEVDRNLSGEALDQAAFSLWLDFVKRKEIDQGRSPSSFSIEDLPSNYVGFISYVKGSRNEAMMWFDIAETLADFVMYHTNNGNLYGGEPYAFGRLGEIGVREKIAQEVRAAVFGVYIARNHSVRTSLPILLAAFGWLVRYLFGT